MSKYVDDEVMYRKAFVIYDNVDYLLIVYLIIFIEITIRDSKSQVFICNRMLSNIGCTIEYYLHCCI